MHHSQQIHGQENYNLCMIFWYQLEHFQLNNPRINHLALLSNLKCMLDLYKKFLYYQESYSQGRFHRHNYCLRIGVKVRDILCRFFRHCLEFYLRKLDIVRTIHSIVLLNLWYMSVNYIQLQQNQIYGSLRNHHMNILVIEIHGSLICKGFRRLNKFQLFPVLLLQCLVVGHSNNRCTLHQVRLFGYRRISYFHIQLWLHQRSCNFHKQGSYNRLVNTNEQPNYISLDKFRILFMWSLFFALPNIFDRQHRGL